MLYNGTKGVVRLPRCLHIVNHLASVNEPQSCQTYLATQDCSNVTCYVQVYQLHSLKVATGEKEPRPGAWTHSLRPNAGFQPCKPPMWPRFFVHNRHIYTVMGGLQCCDHLEPMPWGSVRWYAQRAASMCMCMSPRARGGWWCTVLSSIHCQ